MRARSPMSSARQSLALKWEAVVRGRVGCRVRRAGTRGQLDGIRRCRPDGSPLRRRTSSTPMWTATSATRCRACCRFEPSAHGSVPVRGWVDGHDWRGDDRSLDPAGVAEPGVRSVRDGQQRSRSTLPARDDASTGWRRSGRSESCRFWATAVGWTSLRCSACRPTSRACRPTGSSRLWSCLSRSPSFSTWDRRVDERPVAALYEAFEEALWRRTFADEMPGPLFDRFYRYAGNERFAGLHAIITDAELAVVRRPVHARHDRDARRHRSSGGR